MVTVMLCQLSQFWTLCVFLNCVLLANASLQSVSFVESYNHDLSYDFESTKVNMLSFNERFVPTTSPTTRFPTSYSACYSLSFGEEDSFVAGMSMIAIGSIAFSKSVCYSLLHGSNIDTTSRHQSQSYFPLGSNEPGLSLSHLLHGDMSLRSNSISMLSYQESLRYISRPNMIHSIAQLSYQDSQLPRVSFLMASMNNNDISYLSNLPLISLHRISQNNNHFVSFKKSISYYNSKPKPFHSNSLSPKISVKNIVSRNYISNNDHISIIRNITNSYGLSYKLSVTSNSNSIGSIGHSISNSAYDSHSFNSQPAYSETSTSNNQLSSGHSGVYSTSSNYSHTPHPSPSPSPSPTSTPFASYYSQYPTPLPSKPVPALSGTTSYYSLILSTATPATTGSMPSPAPTVLPTPNPSTAPSVAPTSAPTVAPTHAPTITPTVAPTPAPTVVPSVTPSIAPTVAPTATPTVTPTATPTATPTSAPTYDVLTELTNDYDALATQALSERQFVYSEVVYSGDYRVGGSSEWETFVESTLLTSSYSNQVTSLQLLRRNPYASVEYNASCSNATLATSVVSMLISPNSKKSVINVTCDSAVWSAQLCDSGLVGVCVNCSAPCGGSSCPTATALINPVAFGYCNSSLNYVQLLAVNYSPFDSAPVVTFVSTNTTKTTITAELLVDVDGLVYCAAFTSQPSSTQEIILQSTVVATSNYSATITLSQLSPVTSYTVYCTSVGLTGSELTFEETINTNITVTTKCCKTISINWNVQKSFVLSSDSLNALAVSTDYAPSSLVTLRLFVTNNRTNSTDEHALFPSSVNLTASTSTAEYLSFVSSSIGTVGTYYLLESLSGVSASEYTVEYPTGYTFTVVNSAVDVTAPVITSVRFSDAGNSLSVLFDSPTNKGKYSSSQFYCSSLLSFPGISSSKCQWLSSLSLVAYLDSSSTTVVGDSFSVLRHKIGAAANNSVYVVPTNMTIRTASNPVSPSVVLVVPATISSCASIKIDLTSSSGSGGRGWSNISFALHASSSSNSVTKASKYLKNNYTYSPPASLPAGYLDAGSYNIIVTMCNFLGSCGVGSAKITVVSTQVPTVTVLGNPLRNVYRNATLQIQSTAVVSSCNSSVTIKNNLAFSWLIYVQQSGAWEQLTSLTSTSLASNTFKLSPYKLTAGSVYKLTVQVQYAVASTSAESSMQISVYTSNVVAVISGATMRSVRAGESNLLDAAASYDPDASSSETTSLSYYWYCIQTLPSISSTCGVTMPSTLSASSVTVSADSSSVNSSSTITVTVSTASQKASASVTVMAISASAPVISISTSFLTKVNPSSKLFISAVLSYETSVTAVWSIDDEFVSLSTGALTKLTQTISAPKAASSTVVNILLAQNILSDSATFTITLTAYGGNGLSSTASISVTTNGPPAPGVFTVSPATGVEMTDYFTLSASLWQDDDIPISYKFGFVSSNKFQTVQEKSESSSSVTLLAGGTSSKNYAVVVGVQVIDSLSANTSSYSSTQVTKLTTTSSQLQSSLLSQLSSGGGSTDDLQQVASIGIAILNAVSCDKAPNCTLFNRDECSDTADTCGSCSTGYYGESGDANSYCISTSDGRRLSDIVSNAGSSCSSYSDCSNWESCVNGECVLLSKTCSTNCSNNGICVFVNRYSGRPVSDCLDGDGTCRTKCSCFPGINGDDCSLSDEDYISKKSTRLLLLKALENITTAQDATDETVVSWMSTLSGLTHVTAELSEESYAVATAIGSYAVSGHIAADLTTSSLELLVDVVDDLATYSSYQVAAHRRLSTVQSSLSLLQQYVGLVLRDMVDGQTDISEFYSEFSVLWSDANSSTSTFQLLTPLTTMEIASDVPQHEVSFALPSSKDNVKVALIFLKLESMGSLSSNYHSNPLVIIMGNASLCSGRHSSADACNVTVIVPNIDSITYVNVSAVEVSRTVACDWGVTKETGLSCPSGELSILCDGQYEGYITQHCPTQSSVPVCEALVSEQDEECSVGFYGAVETTCDCQFTDSWVAVFDSVEADLLAVKYLQLSVSTSSVFLPSSANLTPFSPSAAPSPAPTPEPVIWGLLPWQLALVIALPTSFVLLLIAAFIYQLKYGPQSHFDLYKQSVSQLEHIAPKQPKEPILDDFLANDFSSITLPVVQTHQV